VSLFTSQFSSAHSSALVRSLKLGDAASEAAVVRTAEICAPGADDPVPLGDSAVPIATKCATTFASPGASVKECS